MGQSRVTVVAHAKKSKKKQRVRLFAFLPLSFGRLDVIYP